MVRGCVIPYPVLHVWSADPRDPSRTVIVSRCPRRGIVLSISAFSVPRLIVCVSPHLYLVAHPLWIDFCFYLSRGPLLSLSVCPLLTFHRPHTSFTHLSSPVSITPPLLVLISRSVSRCRDFVIQLLLILIQRPT